VQQVGIEANPQASLLVLAFFSLSCFYFLLSILGVSRLCSLEQQVSTGKPKEPNIVRTLLLFVLIACVLRLLGWLMCTWFFFQGSKAYIHPDIYEQI